MNARVLPWFEDEDPRELRRWAIAAAFVVIVHASLIGGYMFVHQPDAIGDESSVVSVELAPIDSMADANLRDVAPAPEEMIEQKATPADTPKPLDQPKVEEPPPPNTSAAELTMPDVKPPEKVEDQRPPAPITAAPVKGGAPRVEPSWESGLIRRLQQAKRYPSEAREHSEEGVVNIVFSVDRTGHVLSRRVVKSSGHADLDTEALALLDRAQPLPAFPASMTQSQISLAVPIRFSLR